MKLKLSILTAFASLNLISSGANYVVTNAVTGDGSGDRLFENATSNTLLSGGIVALGYFPAGFSLAGGIDNVQAFVANFSIVASGIVGSYGPALEGSFPGYVDKDRVDGATITIPNPLLNRDLYAFAGNLPTLAASNAWALTKIDTIRDDVPLENEYQLASFFFNGFPPVIGTIDTYTGNPLGLGVSTFSTLKLAVPEPSSALLGLLGAIGLARRRR